MKKVGPGDAYRAGTAAVGGIPVEAGFFVFEFMGGSMGSVCGEKIARQFERAVAHRRPAIMFCASGGARMQEGVLSLMQMAKAAAILSQLSERRIPYVSILTNPTTGGVSASFSMLGDAILAEPGAVIGFAGPRVIKQTIGQELPEGFQTAEFLLEHGIVDSVVPRSDLKRTVGQLLRHMSGKPASAGWTTS
jgi:acetyl-CoA carboxylase carboxyl transferase subunit beta